MQVEEIQLKPERIYYTQKSISAYSRVGDKEIALRDTIADMEGGKNVDLPPITVIQIDGAWCSLNNRRLFIHKSVHPKEKITCLVYKGDLPNGKSKEKKNEIILNGKIMKT